MYKAILLPLSLLMSLCLNAADYAKSISILGDSYSTYEKFVQPSSNLVWYYTQPRTKMTDVNSVEQTWWHRYIKDNGYRLDTNNSYSGSTVCNTGYRGDDYSAISFIARMDNLGCPDMIFIFGATNDSWANSPLGKLIYDSWTAEDLKSFKPALTYMLSFMTERYINTEIIYIINDGLKEEVTGAIKEACNHYGIRYIELHDIDKTAGHPNIEGMKQIATQLSEALN